MQISDIVKAVNGTCNHVPQLAIDTILIDTRKIAFAPTAIFVCIKTSHNDGHLYIKDAYQAGVRTFLVQDDSFAKKYTDASCIVVCNTIIALQALATAHRQLYNIPIVGITGSNAKTIVKEWLYTLLQSHYTVARNPKSYNSQIGVALSIWELQAQHNFGIFEAGISHKNEMHALQKMIQPSLGIFTNIGDQHSENFESVAQKIDEKLKLFTCCDAIIYCEDHTLIAEHLKEQLQKKLLSAQLISWGTHATANIHITHKEKHATQTQVSIAYKNTTNTFIIPFTDDASIENAMHCTAACLYYQVPAATVAQRLLMLSPVAMRMEVLRGKNNCSIINDSYNNDVVALSMALSFLATQKEKQQRVVILSDILESGIEAEQLHHEIAAMLQDAKIDLLVGIGPEFCKWQSIYNATIVRESYFVETTQDCLLALGQLQIKDAAVLLKGARVFAFEKISLALEANIHQTSLEINLSALTSNFNTYTQMLKPNVAVMAMVKAEGYGSGGIEVANKLQLLGVDYLAVAYAQEGILLRQQGITLPIMVMNPDDEAFADMINYTLEPELFSASILKKFVAACEQHHTAQYPVHLKIDTGMHRLGFLPQDIEQVLSTLQASNAIKVQSVFSHLAASDDPMLDEYTTLQASIFEKAAAQFEASLGYTFYKHICNTSGIVRHPQLHYNMVRLGIGLYGVDHSQLLGKKIKNISRLKTSIAQIKMLKAGDTVGYSRKGLLAHDAMIGTVCIGYADGIRRALGNGKGSMYVNGVLCPIVGNVCMDMSMLDVSAVPNVQEGDEVIVFGPELPVSRVAEMAGTIAYEILTGISQRVNRIYYEED